MQGLTRVQLAASVADSWPEVQAIFDRWRARGVLDPDTFASLSDEIKGQSGRLAKQWDLEFVQDVYDALGKALEDGMVQKDWTQIVQGIIDRYGGSPDAPKLWPGISEKIDPAYANTVFRTNTAASLAGGRYAEQFSAEYSEVAPYWIYYTVGDGRVREEHAALDGLVFRKDDLDARQFLPPSGFNCRCTTSSLTEEEFDEGGYVLTRGASVPRDLFPEPGWRADRVASLVPKALRGAH